MALPPGEVLPYSALFCKGPPFMAVQSSRPKIYPGCLTIGAFVFPFFVVHPYLLARFFSVVFVRPFFLHALSISSCFHVLSSLGDIVHSDLLSQSLHLLSTIALYSSSWCHQPSSLSDSMQASNTVPFSCFFSFLSRKIPSTVLPLLPVPSSVFLHDPLHHHHL